MTEGAALIALMSISPKRGNCVAFLNPFHSN